MIEKINKGQVEKENAPGNEIYIDEKMYPEEFFLDKEQDLDLNNNYILNNYNMTQFEINVSEQGINLFDISINSQFYLENSMTSKNIRKNYGALHPGEDNAIKGGTELDTYSYEKSNVPKAFNLERIKEKEEEQKFNDQRLQQKLDENPHKPTKAALIEMMSSSQKIFNRYDKELRDYALLID